MDSWEKRKRETVVAAYWLPPPSGLLGWLEGWTHDLAVVATDTAAACFLAERGWRDFAEAGGMTGTAVRIAATLDLAVITVGAVAIVLVSGFMMDG